MGSWSIGELARRASVSAPTIRYYERLALLRAPARSPAGYRRYGERALEELGFIKKAQSLGFSLEEIREILDMSHSEDAPCDRVLSLASRHLAAVDQRIERLRRFRDRLAAELAKWQNRKTPTCRGLCGIITGAESGGPDAMDVDWRRAGTRRRGGDASRA